VPYVLQTAVIFYQVPFRPLLAEQFSSAYDIYLEIQRRVDSKMREALGHNSANYRSLHVCPACFYQLEDEVKLEYSFFCMFDGNSSIKRMGA
jgi:hypothetical protein